MIIIEVQRLIRLTDIYLGVGVPFRITCRREKTVIQM